MHEFKAKSGAQVVINPAPWKAAKELKRAIEAEAARSSLPANYTGDDLSPIFSIALKVDSCPDVDAALWPCLIRCTRDNKKIIEETFDDLNARQDYYEIIIACIKENFGPFVEDLIFMLTALGVKMGKPKPKDAPESPSPTTASS